MNWRRAKCVYVKELVDLLRDKRTLLAMIVVPILLYPLLMLGGIQAMSSQATVIEDEDILVGFTSSDDWERVVKPILTEENTYINRRHAEAVANGASEEELAALPSPLIEFVDPKLTLEMDEAIRQRSILCGIVVIKSDDPTGSRSGQETLQLVFQPENLRSQTAANRLKQAFELVARERVDARLAALQIDRREIEPIVLEQRTVTTTGSILGLILPLILVLMTITGAIYPAIDVTAGERERGTLESLMVCPVPVIDLIVGKFLVVTTIAIMGAALNLASVSATVYLGGFDQALDPNNTETGFPIRVLPIILASLVPLAIFMSAIMIAVCSFARSFKEAQNYVMPVILAALLPGGLAALPGTRLEGANMVMPVGNMVLLTRELLSGANVSAGTLAWVLLSTSMYAAAAVAIAAHVFGRESVVFADSVSWHAILNRRFFRKKRLPSLSGVALYAAILFPVWFYVQASLQRADDADIATVLNGSAILMPLFFVILPLIAMRYWKIDWRHTLGIARPSPRYVLAAILIGMAAWVPSHELFVFQERYLISPPLADEMNKSFLAGLKSMSPVMMFVALAVVPAICEELFFRGFLLNGLRSTLRTVPAIIISACVFGAFHFLIFRFFVTAGLGLLLGWLCWRSRSIFPAMIAHALHNAVAASTVVWPEWQKRLGVEDSDKWEHFPTDLLIVGCGVFVLGVAIVALSGREEHEIETTGESETA
jgi:sodium transport system permease protein